jgi:hypothetical protein
VVEAAPGWAPSTERWDDAGMDAPRRTGIATLALTIVLAGLSACGSGGGGGDGACGPILREALDSAYLVHVLGTDTDVTYQSDPPTSGPHQPSPPVGGVVDEPITRPVQVGILERGDVLLQHDPALPADDLRPLEGLAGEHVVVAPNPDLPEPVVATAWVHKRSCTAVDVDALEEFVDQRVGEGPKG